MSITRSSKGDFHSPAATHRSWDVPMRHNIDVLVGYQSVTGLSVSANAVDSAFEPSGLQVRIAPGTFLAPDNSLVAYAGSSGLALPASTTSLVWLTSGGSSGSGVAWPSGPHVRLATVVTDASDVTSITDERTVHAATGVAIAFAASEITLDASHVVVACDATGGAFPVKLPDATTCAGRAYRIKKVDGSANTITVTPNGSQVIEGAATKVLSALWEFVSIVSDGSNWLKV